MKSKRTKKPHARKPCPKVPRRYVPQPGELYPCKLPFIGQTVRIEGRTAAGSIVGEAIGCVKGAKGKPSRVVIGRGTSRGRIAAWLRGEQRRKFGPGDAEKGRPRASQALAPAAPRRPMLALPAPGETSHGLAPLPGPAAPPWALPRLPGYMTTPGVRPPEPVGPALPAPTAFQRKKLEELFGSFYKVQYTNFLAGVLPIAVDMHPDGRMRLVMESLEIPDGILPPPKKPPRPGTRWQMIVEPELSPEHETRDGIVVSYGVSRTHKFDADPAWRTITAARVIPMEGAAQRRPFAHTRDEALEKSRAKSPAKKREVSETHWRNVAYALHIGMPVAREVLADYPGFVSFFGPQVLAGPTRAEVDHAKAVADDVADPDITVRWSVQTGLRLKTRGKEDAIIAAVRRLKADGVAYFKWSSNLQEYYRPQSVGVSESTTDIDRVAYALRRYGMRVRVERGAAGASLGEANEVRAAHKFGRAERYVERAAAAVGEAETLRESAAHMAANIPVGATSRRAEIIAERAERRTADSRAEAAYALHAGSRAEGLAGTAAGYDTTATITRREAEKRADAFAQLFVRKVKAATGATGLGSKRTSNLSEYVLAWNVVYPPSANASARVTFDGRVLDVRGSGVEALHADVSGIEPAEVFARAIAALPKVATDLGDHVHESPETLVAEMGLYGKRRMAAVSKLFPARSKVELWPAKASYSSDGGPSPLHIEVSKWDAQAADWIFETYNLAWPTAEHPEFSLVLKRGKGYHHRNVIASVDVPLRGLTVADAWTAFVGHLAALVTGKPYAPPKPSRAGVRAAVVRGVGGVEDTGREAARAPAAARARGVAERVAPITERARELAQKPGEADVRLAGILANAIREGTGRGFFPTPPDFAREAVMLAGIRPGMRVLEPSAGLGGMVEPLVEAGAVVTAIEESPARAAYLEAAWGSRGVTVVVGDFLQVPPTLFDRVVMNPPFAIGTKRHVDEAHVIHALSFVKPGGRLVAIMSGGSDRADSRAKLHRALAGWEAEWQRVEAGRFRVSGTSVPVVILIADRNA